MAPDFLYVLSLMREKAKSVCPKCNILSLGTYLKTFNYYSYNVNKVAMTTTHTSSYSSYSSSPNPISLCLGTLP